MTRVVVGVDPGGKRTGIVVRRGMGLHHHIVITRGKTETMKDYIGRLFLAQIHARTAAVRADINPVDATVFAIEDVNPPTPHMGIINVTGLLGTAQVLGAFLGWWHERAVVVPPDGNGSAPLRTYPPELVGARETKGSGVLVHCRSAWDVAGRAPGVQLLAEALERVQR